MEVEFSNGISVEGCCVSMVGREVVENVNFTFCFMM